MSLKTKPSPIPGVFFVFLFCFVGVSKTSAQMQGKNISVEHVDHDMKSAEKEKDVHIVPSKANQKHIFLGLSTGPLFLFKKDERIPEMRITIAPTVGIIASKNLFLLQYNMPDNEVWTSFSRFIAPKMLFGGFYHQALDGSESVFGINLERVFMPKWLKFTYQNKIILFAETGLINHFSTNLKERRMEYEVTKPFFSLGCFVNFIAFKK